MKLIYPALPSLFYPRLMIKPSLNTYEMKRLFDKDKQFDVPLIDYFAYMKQNQINPHIDVGFILKSENNVSIKIETSS